MKWGLSLGMLTRIDASVILRFAAMKALEVATVDVKGSWALFKELSELKGFLDR